MNQKSRQTASSKVEKDFYKLLNNSNFGIDCRNNIDNCYLELIYDDIDEIGFIKQYKENLFSDESYREFFSPAMMRDEIENRFENRFFKLNKNYPTYEARVAYLKREKEEQLDAVNSFEKNTKTKNRIYIFGHPSLEEISKFKTEQGQKIEKYFWQEREKLLAVKKTALQNTPRLLLFDRILH